MRINIKPLKSAPDQQMLSRVKAYRWEQFQEKVADNHYLFEDLITAQECYIRLQKVWPEPGPIWEGWTFAFGEGISLLLDGFQGHYHTSVVTQIDRQNGIFHTLNSNYRFEIVEVVDDCIVI